MRRSPLLVSLCIFAAACGAPTEEVSSGAPTEPSPLASCGAGARPVAGEATCTPVGTTEAPKGFTSDTWGFRAIAPGAPCSGANAAHLGDPTCRPIDLDDACSAPFPAAGVTLLVRAGGTPYPGRPDLRVFASVDEAVAFAPAGSTIAIDEGTFRAPVSIAKAVNLVGRCSEKTSLEGASFGPRVESPVEVSFTSLALMGAPKVALYVNSGANVRLDRVFVHGLNDGVVIGNGASLTATRTVFAGPERGSNPNSATAGVHGSYSARVSLDDVEIRGYNLAVLSESLGTEITVRRSILHEQRTVDTEPESLSMLGVFTGARINIVESHVEAGAGRIGVVGAARLDGQTDPTSSGDPPASLRVTRSTLVHAGTRREIGSGLDLLGGATASLDNVTIRHQCAVGIGASDGSMLTLKDSIIQSGPIETRVGMSIVAASRSRIVVDSSVIVGASQFAVMLHEASEATVSRSLIKDTKEVVAGEFASFITAGQALTMASGASAKIEDSAFVGNEGTALFVDAGAVDIERTVFSGTKRSSEGGSTAAVVGINATLAMRRVTFAQNERALALRGGRTLLRDSVVSDSREAIRLDGVSLVETTHPVDDVGAAQLIAARTTFVRNDTKVIVGPLTPE